MMNPVMDQSKHRAGQLYDRDQTIESYIHDSVNWYLTTTLRSPGVMVDAGCHYGYAMLLLKNLGWKTFGIDIDPKSLIPDLDIRTIEMEKIGPFIQGLNEPVDLVMFNHSLEHSKNSWSVLEQTIASLCRGSDIFIAVPSPNCANYVTEAHYTLFTRDFMRFVFKEVGLVEIAYRVVSLREGYEEIQFVGRVP